MEHTYRLGRLPARPDNQLYAQRPIGSLDYLCQHPDIRPYKNHQTLLSQLKVADENIIKE